MSSRRPRHEEEEEHVNHERWLVTYADMVTLLMVLFIVMFAMSQVDQKKFMALKSGLAAGFQSSESLLPGSESVLNEPGLSQMQQIAPGSSIQTKATTAGSTDTNATKAEARKRSQAAQEAGQLDGARRQLMEALQTKGLQDDVQVQVNDRGLVVSLVSRHVTFRADRADLTPRGMQVVDTLAPVLAALPENLEVDGHTNQEPVQPRYYATDWDLSAARAVTVLRRLNEQLGIPADRLSLAAFGDTRPLEDPSTPGSQEVNKRVDIVVLASSDAEYRALAQQQPGTTPTHSSTSATPAGTQADTQADTQAGTQAGTQATGTLGEPGRDATARTAGRQEGPRT